jgi:hypothetical protein
MALTALTGPWPVLSSILFFFSQTVGLLGRVISPSEGRYIYIHDKTNRINAYTDIHALSGIWTHDLSVLASEDSSCLRPSSYCDRHHHYHHLIDQLINYCWPSPAEWFLVPSPAVPWQHFTVWRLWEPSDSPSSSSFLGVHFRVNVDTRTPLAFTRLIPISSRHTEVRLLKDKDYWDQFCIWFPWKRQSDKQLHE